MIRKKLREVLEHSAKTIEKSTLQRTFVPAHLKTQSHGNIDVTTSRSYNIPERATRIPNIFKDVNRYKPGFRRNILQRLRGKTVIKGENIETLNDTTEQKSLEQEVIPSSSNLPIISTNLAASIADTLPTTDRKLENLKIIELKETKKIPDINISPSFAQHIPTTKTVSLIPRQYSYVLPSQEDYPVSDIIPTPFISAPILESPTPDFSSKSLSQQDEFSFVPFANFKDVDLELDGGDSSHIDTFAPVEHVFKKMDEMDSGIDGSRMFEEVRLGNNHIVSYEFPSTTPLQTYLSQTPTPSPSYDLPTQSFQLPSQSFRFPSQSFQLPSQSFQLPSKSFQFPSHNLLPQLPVLTPEQLSYLQLLQQNLFDPSMQVILS